MAAGDTDLGTGTTLTLTDMTGELLSLSASGIERVTVSKAHMGTSGAKPFLLGDQYDPGEITAEINFPADQDIDALMVAAQASITIAFPETTSKTVLGAVTSYSWECPMEDIMTASLTIKITEGKP